MEKTTFVLMTQGSPFAIIIGNEENFFEFKDKISKAIKEEFSIDEDSEEFELELDKIDDWGDTKIYSNFIDDDMHSLRNEFQLRKLVNY